MTKGLLDKNDSFTFGQYIGYSLKEVFAGYDVPSNEFINLFFKSRFNEIKDMKFCSDTDFSKAISLSVESFKILPNCKIQLSIHAPKATISDILTYLNYSLNSSEEFPHKSYYGSANEIILKTNNLAFEEKNETYANEKRAKWEAKVSKLLNIKHENEIRRISELFTEMLNYIYTGIFPTKILTTTILPSDVTKLCNILGINLEVEKFDNHRLVNEFVNNEIIKSANKEYLSPIDSIIKSYRRKWVSNLSPPKTHTANDLNLAKPNFFNFPLPQQQLNCDYFKLFANPGYVFWAINNVKDFFIYPEVLTDLENVDCNYFYGIELKNPRNGVFEYVVKYETKKTEIPQNIKIINEANFQKYCTGNQTHLWDETNHNESEPDDYNFKDESYHFDSGSYCSACQQSTCMCSDPDR